MREYEGQALLGPHSITLSKDGMVFFTDAGPMGETGLSNPKGSVFAIQGSAAGVRAPFRPGRRAAPRCSQVVGPTDGKSGYGSQEGFGN